ncbi:hypothetical protein PAXRUDRAFT_783115 [Paxillus rubicundulus Ve08.2h10]|uniref:Uncharacterized protein n=1 Tax=Paxillus rubicundulus Ve08.2h10 TaxID=930991 RepID=A0A0D0BY61_9AGAM|nr:hypothetical protein PAXRUDRAFT_783115 [Paxillus rubicundulus Ve08.2h10]
MMFEAFVCEWKTSCCKLQAVFDNTFFFLYGKPTIVLFICLLTTPPSFKSPLEYDMADRNLLFLSLHLFFCFAT